MMVNSMPAQIASVGGIDVIVNSDKTCTAERVRVNGGYLVRFHGVFTSTVTFALPEGWRPKENQKLRFWYTSQQTTGDSHNLTFSSRTVDVSPSTGRLEFSTDDSAVKFLDSTSYYIPD